MSKFRTVLIPLYALSDVQIIEIANTIRETEENADHSWRQAAEIVKQLTGELTRRATTVFEVRDGQIVSMGMRQQ